MNDRIEFERDGGPVYPVEIQHDGSGGAVGLQTSHCGGWHTGMTLRDYFAATAINGLLSDQRDGSAWSNKSTRQLADFAYVIADAMLVARKPTE